MSSQRRRAHDFTNSLTSFRQTMSKENSSQTISRAFSENKLDNIRNKQDEDDKYSSKNNKSRDSVILAGSLVKQQCISLSDSCNIAKKDYSTTYNNRLRDTWNVSGETSYVLKPDLNKCINLFHNEHLMKDDPEEQLNTTSETTIGGNINICHLNRNAIMGQRDFNKRPRSMSIDSLESTILPSQEFTRSKSYTTLKSFKRDTNYNIKADRLSYSSKIATKVSHNEEVEKITASFNALSLKPSLLSKKDDFCFMEDNRRYSNCEKSFKDELDPAELKTFLHSLADQKPLKEAATQRLIRRLSANCYDSPKVFTEGLLTIIEESVINNDSLQYPEVSLHRFNEELRKMCKFIEDETIPEWPQSPGMSTTVCAKRRSQEPKTLSWKSLAFETPDKGLCLTSVSPRRNIKSPKKICRRMSKNTSSVTKNLHDSTNAFENLEAYCEKLYPDEYKTPLAKEKDQLQSPLRTMDNIKRVCESQMASLEDSFNIHEEIKKAGRTSNSANQHNKTPEMKNLQQRLMSCEKYNRTDSKKVSDTFKQRTEHSKRHKTIDLDDFEKTLMYEIAKKRRRCLDTAKVMMEIDANLESTEETYPNIVVTESSPTTNDDKFIKILKCVKNYQDYLEEHKSLLNLLHRTRLNSPLLNSPSHDKKNVREKICEPVLLGHKSLHTPKFSPRKKSTSPSSTKRHSINKIVSKPRLFVTPGKTPINKNFRSKRTYFPNLLPGLNKQDEPNSHAKKIYRQMGNYDHVISPVGLYIKGTDSPLKKNLQRSKTETLTPKKKITRLPILKIKSGLSPKPLKKKVPGTIGDKEADNFSHLKVHDKLPSHVHTIKEGENRKGNCE